jgi:hypothetical protein
VTTSRIAQRLELDVDLDLFDLSGSHSGLEAADSSAA